MHPVRGSVGCLQGAVRVHPYHLPLGVAWQRQAKHYLFIQSNGVITNSNLEMVGLVMLWLVIEGVCLDLYKKCITLISDNLPTVSWVTRLASQWSVVVERLDQALVLCLKTMHACPLTPLHIEGKQNVIANEPSRLFSSNPAWTCMFYLDLLTLFNTRFLLPMQQSWTIYHPNCALVMHVMCLADEAFCAEWLDATINMREMCWQNWCSYVKHLGVDPYLHQVPYTTRVQCLMEFAAWTRTGFYRHGRQVQSSTVTGPIMAIGQTVALACNENPTKVIGSDKFFPVLQIMLLEGYTNTDPSTKRKTTGQNRCTRAAHWDGLW